MYNPDTYSARSGNEFTLTLATPAPEKEGKEPGDYEGLYNKPRINGVELVGNMTWSDFNIPGVSEIPTAPLSNDDLDEIIGE